MVERNTPVTEAAMRSATTSWLVRTHAGTDAVLAEEVGMCGAARVDLMLVNGRVGGVEIKSDADTLGRLRAQSRHYGAALETVTLVVGTKLAAAALLEVPEWWHVKLAADKGKGVRLTTLRRGRVNPDLDSAAMARLLEKPELLAVLRQHAPSKMLSGLDVWSLSSIAAEKLGKYNLAACVRERLKWRFRFKMHLGDARVRDLAPR